MIPKNSHWRSKKCLPISMSDSAWRCMMNGFKNYDNTLMEEGNIFNDVKWRIKIELVQNFTSSAAIHCTAQKLFIRPRKRSFSIKYLNEPRIRGKERKAAQNYYCRLFRPGRTSQDIPFRKKIWTFQFKHRSTYLPFSWMYFCNRIIHSWNTASKVPRSIPLKIF
jgi:hypothetical protein